MNYKLIMLPQPILVGRELSKEEAQTTPHFQDFDKRYFEILANIECSPYLDLSLIAKKIGWVDVEKLADEYVKMQGTHEKPEITKHDFIQGFMKASQSLNEKKFSEEDVIEFAKYYEGYSRMISEQKWENAKATVKQFLQMWLLKRKPKEYNVEVEMEEYDHKEEWSEIGGAFETFKTRIKVTKIL